MFSILALYASRPKKTTLAVVNGMIVFVPSVSSSGVCFPNDFNNWSLSTVRAFAQSESASDLPLFLTFLNDLTIILLRLTKFETALKDIGGTLSLCLLTLRMSAAVGIPHPVD